ncbi:MAG TPA: bifunctional isocitrate dehydrogenase kinase/phosphatase [Casimicrobiaceae bacterium]|nr:bifunctional isocitrate dehydrogenase kinase/phosphatase [Casimicrobiaceae bacterium]
MAGGALAATPASPAPSAHEGVERDARPREASAEVIAHVLIEGFDRHYALFRECAKAAKRDFEAANWLAIGHLARDRIDFYDRRVAETVEHIERDFRFSADDAFWAQVKQQFVGLLAEHRQPECAETFFNTVSTKLLHRTYFHNRCLFVRPAASTEYLDDGAPSYRCYYPRRLGLRATLIDVVLDFGLRLRFADFRADLRNVLAAMRRRLPRPFVVDANCQIQILSSLLFRNQTAYAVGRVVNAEKTYPFVAPIKRRGDEKLYVDALLSDPLELALLFSANRAYFLVDMEVPSAYVEFLRAMLPDKTTSELYTMLGLQKHGKTLFYRDFLHHLKHSTDRLVAAPGIRGLVMSVFTLPSYPYVFKVIRDRIAPSKDTDAARVEAKYALVKHHDRAGRMTDTLEYSDVAIPRARFTDALFAELEATIASRLELDGDYVVIRHVYIERRLVPLNLFLADADDAATSSAVRDYGNALKELAAVNIFPGDLLFKNFGVTRYGRVVFYDYDEIEYLTDCRFRSIPQPPAGVDELSDEVWHPVGPHDIFPEEFARFLLTDASVRRAFVAFHADLLEPAWWQAMQEVNRGGVQIEVLSYPERVRFNAAAATPPSRTLLAP